MSRDDDITKKPDCCICGKKDLSTVEGDGGDECQLTNGEWVCSFDCWDKAVNPSSSHAEAETL